VPVTAKLSRKFYERFGDDIANELVDWFNMVDATYRSELRELNELNYGRFDAKLEQRVIELDAKIDRLGVELETKIDRLAVELRAEMQVGFARMDQQFAQFEATLTKRMFVFWIGQAATTVGLVFGVVKLLH
jgi:phosphate uptake regulator